MTPIPNHTRSRRRLRSRVIGRLADARRRWRGGARRGRILAVKWGLNPNSSSLGVDVTFLLFGAAALSLATPVIAALVRLRRPAASTPNRGEPDAADRQAETPADR